jgi:hypothetical protein
MILQPIDPADVTFIPAMTGSFVVWTKNSQVPTSPRGRSFGPADEIRTLRDFEEVARAVTFSH